MNCSLAKDDLIENGAHFNPSLVWLLLLAAAEKKRNFFSSTCTRWNCTSFDSCESSFGFTCEKKPVPFDLQIKLNKKLHRTTEAETVPLVAFSIPHRNSGKGQKKVFLFN